MYGSIAKMNVTPGSFAKLEALSADYDRVSVPGHLGTIIFRSDGDENEYWLVVAFESREAYIANAQSSDQHARYLVMRDLLTAEPEWHDGEIVNSTLSLQKA